MVSGGDDAPHPAHARRLWDLIDRFEEVTQRIEGYLAGLPLETPIVLEDNAKWRFRAEDCGFRQGWFRYGTLWVVGAEPTTARITLYTGLPDGYLTYEVTLEAGQPTTVTAFCS